MKFAKVFKFGKKGAKHVTPKGGAGGGSKFDWPAGFRVGIVGPTNAGKTVYLAILNEDCKYQRDLQISTSGATAAEFLSNLRKIRGISQAVGEGTRVDVSDEKTFPELTRSDKVLQFTAILEQSRKVPVVSLDYPGDAVSISRTSESTEKVTDFMTGANGLLFFFDPKKLLSDEWQTDSASFVNMIQRLGPLNSKLSVPVALVITKADVLPGFRGEEQVKLVSSEDEPIVSESYEDFVISIINQERIAENPQWQKSVREILERLRDFLRVVLTRTLDFQIFFVSSTGEEPDKIGVDIGRSLYRPPDVIRPAGVREPFKWLLAAGLQRRRISRIKKFKSWVRLVCLAWIILVSAVSAWHLWWDMRIPTSLEDQFLSSIPGQDPTQTTQHQRRSIRNAYKRYGDKWLVRKLFPEFGVSAKEIAEHYDQLRQSKAREAMSVYVQQLADGIAGGTGMPSLSGSGEVKISAAVQTLLADIASFEADSGTVQAGRAARIAEVWRDFTACVATDDSATWRVFAAQVDEVAAMREPPVDEAEKSLYSAFKQAAGQKRQTQQTNTLALEAEAEYETLKGDIESKAGNASFALDTAVTKIRRYLREYGSVVSAEASQALNGYLSKARWFDRERTYTCRIDKIPSGGHVHIYSVPDRSEPAWDEWSQYSESSKKEIKWAPGHDIFVAFDLPHVQPNPPESFGERPTEKIILRNKFSIFDLAQIQLKNVDGTIEITLMEDLTQKLPKL
jgi:hypothetical protein